MPARMTMMGMALFLIASLRLSAAAGQYPKLEELYAGKQFFDLRDAGWIVMRCWLTVILKPINTAKLRTHTARF